jgi:sec-independent protein translocase protein TatA
MGFHPLDWVIILAIGLILMGPKTIQSIARGAGKTAGQAKNAKDKLLAELPMEELEQVRNNISRIPLSPQQAVQMLLTPEQAKQPDEQGKQPTQAQEAQIAQDIQGAQAEKQGTNVVK